MFFSCYLETDFNKWIKGLNGLFGKIMIVFQNEVYKYPVPTQFLFSTDPGCAHHHW